MMDYRDLGFSGFLTKSLFKKRQSSADVRGDLSSNTVGAKELKKKSIDNEQVKYNYRGFNAVVDAGGNGDFKDIQEAIIYVNDNGGGRILIKKGTYTQTTDIIMYDNITLEGEGSYNGTNISFNSLGNGIFIHDLNNVRITNLCIIGSASSTIGAIDIDDSTRIKIDNVFFSANVSGGSGIDIRIVGDSYNVSVSDCTGEGGETFLYMDSSISSPKFFTNISLTDYSGDVIFGDGEIDGLKGVFFSNVSIYTFAEAAIKGQLNHCKFSNIYIYNSGTSTTNVIDITSGSSNEFTNLEVIANATGDLINIDRLYNQFTNCYIENGSSGDVVDISNTHNSFSNCRMVGSTSTNKILRISGNDNKINSCQIINTSSGIPVEISSAYNGITNCNLDGNSSNAYTLQCLSAGDGNMITGCKIGQYATNAVRFDSGADYNVLTGNRVFSSVSDAGTGNVDSGNA